MGYELCIYNNNIMAGKERSDNFTLGQVRLDLIRSS